MKRTLAAGTLLIVVLLVFGCSLGGSAYHVVEDTACVEIETKDPDLIDVLELAGYTKGSCPTSYKASKGCEYIDVAYDTSVIFYDSESTDDDMKLVCDILDGTLVN